MDTLNDLLAASDVISLHCALTNETIQIISADCLQHIKPGAFLVNTGSSQLLDDCAVKQLLIDGTCRLCPGWCRRAPVDGSMGMMNSLRVREMPNVLILPRSADYSEEVWMEIREKAISILQRFFVDNLIPENAVSDEEEEDSVVEYENEPRNKLDNETSFQGSASDRANENIQLLAESSQKKVLNQSEDASSHNQGSVLSQNALSRSEIKRSRSSKKAKKRHGRQKSQHKADDTLTFGKESTTYREDDASLSTDQALSSSSRCASPEDSRNRKTPLDLKVELPPDLLSESSVQLGKKSGELLKDGCIIALHARSRPALHVSRQRVQGGGWFLDTLPNVTKRDPAAQFLVVFRSKDTIGLRSFTAGGKLLQINRRMEFVFASHSFDVWESWTTEGSLEECRLVNCRNPLAVLDVRIEIVAAVDRVLAALLMHIVNGKFRPPSLAVEAKERWIVPVSTVIIWAGGIPWERRQLTIVASVTSSSSSSCWNPGAAVEDHSKRVRKPYTITKSRESWSEQEHDKFLEALHLFDRDWKKIEAFVGSKTVIQIRSHAQKYFLKVQKNGTSEHVPPPRPKRKAAHPYPQKAPRNAALLESGYALRPDSVSVPEHTITSAPLYSWTYNGEPTDSGPHISKGDCGSSGVTIRHNCSSSSNDLAPRWWTSTETNRPVKDKEFMQKRVMPDFAQVYSFLGSLFDPSASDHLLRLKKMSPVNVETVLMLMKNLSVNLVSPEFENHRRLLLSHNVDVENHSMRTKISA
ncbi:UNVERIFIED_CONTAM: C-terminal binding protein AN [Sesamum latifolium]|uniref:C-terminal binding protein AN n=1 Tax=Sesamum latifolium TaxID=2727402 RepID=A0AAW2YGJ0_9LAMI